MVITGLSAGEYILQETVAPLGHMPIDDYHLTLGEGSQGTTISLRLVDPIFAYTLPETGGSGTTMYIVVGFALVLTGGFLLYCKRRREAVENL
jgi:LPXTG-motif cell wall-anchored protein